MLRTRWLPVLVAALATLATGTSAMAALPAAASAAQPDAPAAPAAPAPPAWQPVSLPSSVASPDALDSVTATGPADAWAVGAEQVTSQVSPMIAVGTPLILHWNGLAWAKSALPSLGWTGELLSVSADSPTDAWTAGVDGTGLSHVLHWDGRSWQPVPFPGDADTSLTIRAVAAGPDGSAWLAGSDSSGPVLEQWDGQAWHTVATPVTSGAFYGVQASAAGVWVTGQSTANDDYLAVVLQRAGGGWTELTTASLVLSTSEAEPLCCALADNVLASSPLDIWVVGSVYNTAVPGFGPFPEPWIAHWNGIAWDYSNEIPVSSYGRGNTITPGIDGQPQWVAAGTFDQPTASAQYLSFGGGTNWTTVIGPTIPGDLLYVSASAAHVPGTNATWSVAYADSEAPGAAGIEYNPG